MSNQRVELELTAAMRNLIRGQQEHIKSLEHQLDLSAQLIETYRKTVEVYKREYVPVLTQHQPKPLSMPASFQGMIDAFVPWRLIYQPDGGYLVDVCLGHGWATSGTFTPDLSKACNLALAFMKSRGVKFKE